MNSTFSQCHLVKSSIAVINNNTQNTNKKPIDVQCKASFYVNVSKSSKVPKIKIWSFLNNLKNLYTVISSQITENTR